VILRLLQLLLILALVRAGWRLLKGVIEGAGYIRVDSADRAGQRKTVGTKLARDPICGTYVSPASALAARVGGETMYFCSDKCRGDWERSFRR